MRNNRSDNFSQRLETRFSILRASCEEYDAWPPRAEAIRKYGAYQESGGDAVKEGLCFVPDTIYGGYYYSAVAAFEDARDSLSEAAYEAERAYEARAFVSARAYESEDGGVGTIPEDWQTFAENCGEN